MADWIVEPGGLPQPVPGRPPRPDADWQFDELPDDERQRVRWFVEQLSWWMDAVFEVPGLGVRFGLDALVGLIPVLGDLATTLVSLYIIGLAGQLGLPRITLARMSLNVLVDMLVGAVPLVGDVFDVWWKANRRNARLLADRLAAAPFEPPRAKASDWLFVGLMLAGLAAVFAALVVLAAVVFAALWRAAAHLFSS
jgi:hypothetical protein